MCIAIISNPQLTTVINPRYRILVLLGFVVNLVPNTLVFVCYYNEWKKQPKPSSLFMFLFWCKSQVNGGAVRVNRIEKSGSRSRLSTHHNTPLHDRDRKIILRYTSETRVSTHHNTALHRRDHTIILRYTTETTQ